MGTKWDRGAGGHNLWHGLTTCDVGSGQDNTPSLAVMISGPSASVKLAAIPRTSKAMTERRSDITDRIVHFTNGSTNQEAFSRLKQILDARTLLGRSEKIRGGFECVCFTEAPITSLPGGLVNPQACSRYRPFGVMFHKAYVFTCNGRPVIYQSDNEYEELPEQVRWRHVRYEPHVDPPIDFSWEREWRVQTDRFEFTPGDAELVLPNRRWAERLIADYDDDQDWIILEYSQVLDEDTAELYREDFPWRIVLLG